MVGITVGRQDLDWKASRAIVAIREGFTSAAILKGFLDQYPSDAGDGDVLTRPSSEGGFGYSPDEAYLLRLIFDQFSALDVEPTLALGRKLTGLE